MSSKLQHDAEIGRSRLQHHLENPLTLILAHTHRLRRHLQQRSGLRGQEQATLLANVLSIEEQVHVLVARVGTVQGVTYVDPHVDRE